MKKYLEAFLDYVEDTINSEEKLDFNGFNREDIPVGIRLLTQSYSLTLSEESVLHLALSQEVLPVRTRVLLSGVLGIGVDIMSISLTPYLCMELLPSIEPLIFLEQSPLFRYGILRSSQGVTSDTSMRTLSIAPGVLRVAQGSQAVDPELSAFSRLLEKLEGLSLSQVQTAEKASRHLNIAPDRHAVLLYGNHADDMRAIGGQLLSQFGEVLQVDIAVLAQLSSEERYNALRALGRETVLQGRQILVNAMDDAPEGHNLDALIEQVLEHSRSAVAVLSPIPLPMTTARSVLPLEVLPPTVIEQNTHWGAHLKVPDILPTLGQLGDQFRLSLGRIERVANETLQSLPSQADPESRIRQAWQMAKLTNRRAIGQLAQRVDTRATWEDLILPDADRAVLEQIAAHVRYRSRVYEELGMSKPGRGKAITALFSGPSGTGKTLSAEVLANELNLDLYRIDMSSTISKYIGETEKNLRKIFDAADQGGCILLFDEADSVFGKRGEVKDANDRYANVQVNYLLQRLETFNGLAILTTNMESSMDIAFMRRLQFVLNFRAPGVAERERLWRKAFPPTVDTSEIDFAALAKAEVSGGNIRSIAVNAVLTAISRDQELSQEIVEEALHLEYRKLGRLIL